MQKTNHPTGHATPDTSPAQALRQRAEEILCARAAQSPATLSAKSPEEVLHVLHDLQVHQIELEMQNEELHQIQAALEILRSRYFDLYDTAPVGYLTVGEAGQIQEANLTAAALLGVPRHELVKQPFSGFILSADEDIYYIKHQQLLETGNPQAFDLRVLGRDHTQFWAHLKATIAYPSPGTHELRIVLSDITESRRAAEFLRLIVNNIPDFVFWKDRNSVFQGCNNAFAQAAGMDTPAQIVGKTDYDLGWKKEESDFYVAVDRQVMESDHARYHIIETQLQLGGQQRWIETCKIPLHDEQGQVIGILGTYLDITERKQAEDEIRQLNSALDQRVSERTAQLEAVVKELDAFSYSVSHDLRVPLRAVDGFSRILADEHAAQLDEDGLRILGVIRSETHRMGQLIDDLLAFAKLSRLPIEQEPIDMHALAQAVFDELAEHESGRSLQLDLHPLPPAYGTKAMIRQVWSNLIGNAIKFSQQRAVAEIEIGVQEGKDGVAVYYVKDNGAGFDMRYVDKLFGVFQRLHTQQEFAGTGVGLALVQRILQRHGGSIWAVAEINRGATFSFTLPKPRP